MLQKSVTWHFSVPACNFEGGLATDAKTATLREAVTVSYIATVQLRSFLYGSAPPPIYVGRQPVSYIDPRFARKVVSQMLWPRPQSA